MLLKTTEEDNEEILGISTTLSVTEEISVDVASGLGSILDNVRFTVLYSQLVVNWYGVLRGRGWYLESRAADIL